MEVPIEGAGEALAPVLKSMEESGQSLYVEKRMLKSGEWITIVIAKGVAQEPTYDFAAKMIALLSSQKDDARRN